MFDLIVLLVNSLQTLAIP